MPENILDLPWPDFLRALGELSEESCWTHLAIEKSGKQRNAHLSRLYGRANQLRAQRERREWLGE